MKVLDDLFEQADYYLDINHAAEIVSAVEKAFLHNQLIFAFKETLHNARYVPQEHIFTTDRANELVTDLKSVMGNTALLKEGLERQRTFAMLETKETYLGI